MTLPTDYQRSDYRYYVYFHRQPATNAIVYVGMGQGGRAWTFGNSGKDAAAYGHRSNQHYRWYVEHEYLYCVADLVEIMYDNLLREEALELESRLILEHSPVFNKAMGLKLLKLDSDQYALCKVLREEGETYLKIAEEIGVSSMTVYRALNNQTKNIGEDY